MAPTALPLRTIALLCLCASCAPRPAPPVAPAISAHVAVGAPVWESLKRDLSGDWELEGKPFRVSYHVVSGGSALVESWGAGGPHETVTMFHPDHDDVWLVHYCGQGNQPRLRAEEAGPDGVTFRFVDATNVRPGQAVLVERRLRVGAGARDSEDTEVYRQPSGANETTVYRFHKT